MRRNRFFGISAMDSSSERDAADRAAPSSNQVRTINLALDSIQEVLEPKLVDDTELKLEPESPIED